jgi:hypothetical protein
MEMQLKNQTAENTGTVRKKVRKNVSRIKLVFDKNLEILSGTILFPEKLDAANKFLSKSK